MYSKLNSELYAIDLSFHEAFNRGEGVGERHSAMTIKVHVEVFSAFQSICGSSHFTVELEDQEATTEGLLRWLSKEYGEKMEALLFEKGKDEVVSGLMVMVNDRIFTGNALNQKDVPLQDRDKVNLLYFVSGG